MPKVNIKISRKVFNDIYYPYLNSDERYLVFYGGGGSGKSFFVAQRYIHKMLKSKLFNLLVVRQTGDTNRDSTFALLKQVITKWKLENHFKINESDLRIKCKLNGNEIIFKGLDDPEKLKSVTFTKGELTDVWIEEASETEEAAFNQLDIRLRGAGTKKQIVISFNPVDVNHWLKKRFFDTKPSNAIVLHTTYKNNKFLDDDYIKLLESYKTTDPYYYDVYCLGLWGVLGKTVFNAHKVNERIAQIKNIKPCKKGYFEYEYVNEKIVDSSIKWVDAEDGFITIYEDRKSLYPYAIGGDTAGDGSDNFAAHVIDNTNCKQVAVLHNQFDEDLFTKQIYCLGKYYNNALIGIETNYSTYPVNELQRLGYSTMYMREEEDSITFKLEKKYGFKTTKVTRPLILSELIALVRDSIELFVDEKTLNEMLTFVRNKKGRPEAAAGAHDDLVMALAITYYIREQQLMKPLEIAQEKKTSLINRINKKSEARGVL